MTLKWSKLAIFFYFSLYICRKTGKRGKIGKNRNKTYEKEMIVNGRSIPDMSMYPFLVKGDGCGGVIIAPSHFMTAAHCVQYYFLEAHFLYFFVFF